MNDKPPRISPEAIAAARADAAMQPDHDFARQLEKHPRLLELLWFLEWTFRQPGGAKKFAADLVRQFAPQFGPACLHTFTGPLTLAQREEIWRHLSIECKNDFVNYKVWHWDDGGSWGLFNYPTPTSPEEEQGFLDALLLVDETELRQAFAENATEDLPSLLMESCQSVTGLAAASPWYCKRLLDVLFEAMEAHASRAELAIARTDLVEKLFEKLDYAWHHRRFLRLEGDSRTGKTKSLETYCAMYPGRARLVRTPPGRALRDLYAAVAEALGLEFNPDTPVQKLKNRVEHVIRHAGLFLLFDEAHWLLPPPGVSSASPARLDWVRSAIIDRRQPVAFISTPQAFGHAVEKFKKQTGYNFDQFFGRADFTFTLPSQITRQDILQVVETHGEDIPLRLRQLIEIKVSQREGYLSRVESICCLARYIGRRAGHASIEQSDVESAICEVLGVKPPSAAAPAGRPLHPPMGTIVPKPALLDLARPSAGALPDFRADSQTTPALTAPARQTSLTPIEA